MSRTRAREPMPALPLMAGIAAIEIIGGLCSSSLALVADAIGLIAYASESTFIWSARHHPLSEPATRVGRDRLTAVVLGAYALCLLASACIVYEAHRRALDPAAINAGLMLIVAVGSLVGSLAIGLLPPARFLPGADAGTNRKSIPRALFAPLQLVVTAILVMATGWPAIDPIVAAAIAFYVILRTLALTTQAIRYRAGHSP